MKTKNFQLESDEPLINSESVDSDSETESETERMN